jgi:hypothetical protein
MGLLLHGCLSCQPLPSSVLATGSAAYHALVMIKNI